MGVGERSIEVDAVGGIRHGHHDNPFEPSLEDQFLSRFVDAPFYAKNGALLIKYILPVLEIQGGISPGVGMGETRREIHKQLHLRIQQL